MRIVTWNCYRGECRARASRLDSMRPDIAVLQECGKPASVDDRCLWFGTRPVQGVGVVAQKPWRLRAGALASDVPDSAYPVEVSGPASFHILAVWAMRRPTYVRAILDALDHYRDFVQSAPCVVLGDFNSHRRWDAKDPTANHTMLERRLRDEFGQVSAFHAYASRSGASEEPATLYWQWRQQRAFHIDYCFIPEHWVPRLNSVEIGGYEEWSGESDHRPLAVELRL